MNRPEKWDKQKLRANLAQLADKRFRESVEFVALLEQIGNFAAPQVVAKAHSWGYSMEVQEAEHMMLVRLLEESGTHETGETRYIFDYVCQGVDPWAYLVGCATNVWLQDEYGLRGADLEGEIEFLANAPAAATAGVPGGKDHPYTDLEDVVWLCFETLAPRTPPHLRGELKTLLGFLAANPPQRLSYEHHERAAAREYCPSFTDEQIAAVMNIAWGGRPRRAETSLMGKFLMDDMFQPVSSPTHARALRYYQKEILARSNGSRGLEGWKA